MLPEYIARHPQIDRDVIIKYLKERVGMLEGVVICGGEPTLNKDLKDFCFDIKKNGVLYKA